jgi:phosphate transport system substrate-binding protein
MHKVQDKPAQGATVLNYFGWALNKGEKTAESLDYVPMPPSVVKQIEKQWTEVKDPSGKPIALKSPA